MVEKKTKIIWEEISFSEPSIEALRESSGFKAVSVPSVEVESPEKKSLKLKAELVELKESLKAFDMKQILDMSLNLDQRLVDEAVNSNDLSLC